MIADHATIGTLFGHRRGRITLAIQEDPHSLPYFVLELPIHSTAFNKEMSCDIVRIAFETETKSHKKKLTEEYVWAVYCNGRKVGYSIRRTQLSDDEMHVFQTLRGVSMGAGVLPEHHNHDPHDDHDSSKREKADQGDQITYLRARFERVVGSKDSEALYMINPDNADGPELSIFFVRVR